METFPDLGALTDQELKELIQQLTEEEQELSYRRRILHGKIDILRAELVNRLRKKHETGEDVMGYADVERLTDILSGVAVCWRFDLLPRWALAVLIAREVAVVALARIGLRRGQDLKINWPGRLAVWPTMSAIVFALIGVLTLAEVLLYVGLALGLAALAMYARDGVSALHAAR